MRNFGPEATDPRTRRAYAHMVVGQYKNGEVKYNQAFEVVRAASQTRKGRESGLGRALGHIFIAECSPRPERDEVIVGGYTSARQIEVVASGTEDWRTRMPDVYFAREDVNNIPPLHGIIEDPIAEGYTAI